MKRSDYQKKVWVCAAIPVAVTDQAGITLGVNTLLISIAIMLLLIIGILAYMLLASTELHRKRREQKKSDTSALKSLLLIGALIGGMQAFGQEGTPIVTNPFSEAHLLRNILIGTIVLEFIIILALIYWTRFFTGIEELNWEKAALKKEQTKKTPGLWARLNKFKPIEEEDQLDVGHSYDGIRELDNPTPTWFTIAFIASILFGIGYLWRYEVAHSGMNQYEELEASITKANLQLAAYMKTKGDAVNENTVTMLDVAGISAGKTLFMNNCTACHGNEGQGGVGPNLTDDYWLHGGGIGDVFKTIKLGVVEKGMMSWKDIFSAEQIAQISSYIKSIHGTNPAGAKEAQGDLYQENAEVAGQAEQAVNQTDSSSLKLD